jgi:hypothetical protein
MLRGLRVLMGWRHKVLVWSDLWRGLSWCADDNYGYLT